MAETRRSWCSVCGRAIWYQRLAPPGWRHDREPSNHPAQDSADVVAEVADERVKERLFSHPTRRPRRDPVGAYYESIGAEEVAQLDKRGRAVREMDR